jgi:hypothetical protein
MVLAQVRPWRRVGDGWKQPATAADSSPHRSKTLGDDHHAGRMGVRIEDGKLTITVFSPALANAICWRRGAHAHQVEGGARGARHDRQPEEQDITDG